MNYCTNERSVKHVSITSSVVTLVILTTISVSILSEMLVWVADVLKGGRVVMGRGVVVMSEGMVGKTVTGSTGSTSLVLSVDDSSSVVSDRGDSIDGTMVEILAVISADVTVIVVLLVEVMVVGAAWVVVVVGVVVVEVVVVVDGDDVVSSVVLVCEIVSRCDVWHEKRVVSYVRKERRSCTNREPNIRFSFAKRDFRDAICTAHF